MAAGILSGILGWMSARCVVNLIETGDVLDVDGRSRRWIVAVDAELDAALKTPRSSALFPELLG